MTGNYNLILDGETIIGYAYDVKEYAKDLITYYLLDKDDCSLDLALDLYNVVKDINDLNAIIKCDFNPMGAYTIKQLKEVF